MSKLTRRGFLKSGAVVSAISTISDAQAKSVPFCNGDIVHPQTIDGVFPLENERVTVFKFDPEKGLGIFEGEYRGGKFYIRDFTTDSMPFTVEFEPEYWNIVGGHVPAYALAKIRTLAPIKLTLAQLAELTK